MNQEINESMDNEIKKTTINTRLLDNLGRVVIPINIRRSLNLNEGDNITFEVVGDSVVLKKSERIARCVICKDILNIELIDAYSTIDEQHICRICLEKFNKSNK